MKFINLPTDYIAAKDAVLSRFDTSMIDSEIVFDLRKEMLVGYKDGKGYITCSKKNQFTRLLGLFIRHVKEGEFEIKENPAFDTLSCMLDVSNGSAPTVGSIKEYCLSMALCGYNQFQLYLEDMYEMEGLAHFGYMRGKYSFDELKEIDDYAYALGIEVVPCMQTLGHMQRYLSWSETAGLSENGSVLLPDSEATYDFIEKMILAVTSPFRSKRIHVGLDETAGLGLGKYLSLHGYTDPLEIFIRHLNRVSKICKSHGLKPQMWNDMIFCFSPPDYNKYSKRNVVPGELADAIDPDMEIVYWHYGEALGCDGYMIDKHKEMLGRTPIFAGGVWIWPAGLTDNVFSAVCTEEQLRICKEKGIKEVMLTVWSYCTTIYQTSLTELVRYAELTYRDTSDDIKGQFEFISGASYDAFMEMSNFHGMYASGVDYTGKSHYQRLVGNKIFWSDILLGVPDELVMSNPRSTHYAKMVKYFQNTVNQNKNKDWDYLYRYCLAVFEYMESKCYCMENLTRAYKESDRATLERIADGVLPKLLSSLEKVHEYHTYHKEKYLRPFGAENVDHMYGGQKERVKSAVRRLKGYLNGDISALQELEEPRLPFPAETWGCGYNRTPYAW